MFKIYGGHKFVIHFNYDQLTTLNHRDFLGIKMSIRLLVTLIYIFQPFLCVFFNESAVFTEKKKTNHHHQILMIAFESIIHFANGIIYAMKQLNGWPMKSVFENVEITNAAYQ